MKKKWDINNNTEQELVEKLAGELNVDPIIAILLILRGINSYEEARKFFRPELNHLHDPFLMEDMDKAIARLDEAIRKNQKILVYGDYDVDGTTSVALVYLFITKFYKNVEFYVPDRYSEGYGISKTGIDYAKEINVSLVIALDCGIKAVEQIEYANQLNIDFIICDHHTPDKTIPNAVAVLDPKKHSCNYPYKHLSGCGVGFKLLQAFCEANTIPYDDLNSLLDLVAVSIASDIVPITGENRILAYYGLRKLNSNPTTGLKSIIKVAGIEGRELLINDIVFKIGPRINAAGRMESAKKAVELLISKDDNLAFEIGESIERDNEDRKKLDRQITTEALEIVSKDEALINKKTTVLYNPYWHKGVIGIVASRLIDHYYRPTVILTESNGFATGSARSVDGFDLYKAVESCSDLLENFGGHMYAAGLTMKIENVSIFTERFEQFVSENIESDMLIPKINIDAKIQLKNINGKLLRVLKQFQPFGPGNMTPIFSSENVGDSGSGRIVGKNAEHLMLTVTENNCYNQFHGIAYKQAECYPLISNKKLFDICYSIEENNYRGNTSLQLRVRDIKA